MLRIVLVLSLLLTSCTTARSKKFASALDGGRCEEALENIPEHGEDLKFSGSVRRATGTVLSYVAAGAGYTADVALNIGTGVLLGTAICAPILLATRSTNVDLAGCYPAEFFNLVDADIGGRTFQSTESWRCPDLTALSQSVRKVARCHAGQGVEGAKNALTTLSSIKSNAQFMNCITAKEKAAVLAEYSSYENDALKAR